MKKIEARDIILTHLFKIFDLMGFKIQKNKYRLYKKTDFGWMAIGLPMSDYNPLIKFNFLLQVRHNIINNNLEQHLNIDKRYRNETTTIVTHLCNLTEEPIPYIKSYCTYLKSNGDFEVSTLSELEIVLAAIEPYLKMGKEYFTNYSNLMNIHERLNIEHKDEMAYPYHGHIKLLVANQCNKSSLRQIHAYNLKKMAISLEYVRAEYILFYEKIINLNDQLNVTNL